MKKVFITGGKLIIFFVGWALLAGLLPIPDTANAAIWRFWAECIPMLSVIGLTFVFWLVEKKNVKLYSISSPLRSIVIGIVAGSVWIGLVTMVLMLLGNMKVVAHNSVSMLGLWIFSVFINTIMQELLVRGYLYQMLKINYNVVVAAIISTALFLFMHGGVWEAGIVPVINIITMSLLMTFILEYTQSLLAPIIMHFIWNAVGAVILGGVSLADDYPSVCVTVFTGNTWLSGGVFKMEGSVVVLLLNIVFILLFALLLKKQKCIGI